jgi:hypothetical protein
MCAQKVTPEREMYVFHTNRVRLDIGEQDWVGDLEIYEEKVP